MSVVIGRDPVFGYENLYKIHYYFPKRSKYREELSSFLKSLAEKKIKFIKYTFTNKTHKGYYTATIEFSKDSDVFDRMEFVIKSDLSLRKHLLEISNNRCKRGVNIFNREPKRTDGRYRRRYNREFY